MKYLFLITIAGLCSSCSLGSGAALGSGFSIRSMEACSLTAHGQEELIKKSIERFELVQKAKQD